MIQLTILTKEQQNLFNFFQKATDNEFWEGVTWYQKAHELAADIATRLITDFGTVAFPHQVTTFTELTERVIGVLAAISPLMPWERNIQNTETAIRKGYINGTPLAELKLGIVGNVKKGQDIWETGDFGRLGTRKTFHFFQNITNPLKPSGVTVDAHAHRAWLGDLSILYESAPCRTDKQYKIVSNDYTVLADIVELLPHQVQAIVWVVFRRMRIAYATEQKKLAAA